MPRTKSKKQAKKKTVKKPSQPKGCINCDCFKRETDAHILKRGYSGQCHGESTMRYIDKGTIDDKKISNTCPLYTVEEKQQPSCKGCDHFKPEKDLAKIRRNIGGECKHKKGNFIVSMHISNSDEYPDNCPMYGG